MISLWGSRRAGKTVFLSAMWFAIRERRGDGWRILPSPGQDGSVEFVVEAFETFTRGVFPAPTDETAAVRDRSFFFDVTVGRSSLLDKVIGRRPAPVQLAFVDPAGEHFENPRSAQAGAVFESMRGCSGLLCLIDPLREWNEYFPLVLRNFMRIRDMLVPAQGGAATAKRPIAVCVTKGDQFPFTRGDQAEFERVASDAMGRRVRGAADALAGGERVAEAVARQVMGEDACNVIEDIAERTGRVRWFLSSSVGFAPDGRPNITRGVDGRETPAGMPSPINVLEPVEWLSDAAS